TGLDNRRSSGVAFVISTAGCPLPPARARGGAVSPVENASALGRHRGQRRATAPRTAADLPHLRMAQSPQGRGPQGAGAQDTQARPQPGRNRKRKTPPGEGQTRQGTSANEGRTGNRGKSTRALGNALRECGLRREAQEVIDAAFAELEPISNTKFACDTLGKSRSTVYRQRHPRPRRQGPRRPMAHPAQLSPSECEQVIATLNSERFWEKAPAQVWATLL